MSKHARLKPSDRLAAVSSLYALLALFAVILAAVEMAFDREHLAAGYLVLFVVLVLMAVRATILTSRAAAWENGLKRPSAVEALLHMFKAEEV